MTRTDQIEPDRDARPEVLAALRQGYRRITAVTWLFRLAAAGYGTGTLIAVLALGHAEVPVLPGVMVVALFALMTIFMLACAIQVLFEPFAWTLATAALASAVVVAHLAGPNPLDAAHWWSLAWAVVFCAALPSTWSMHRLMREHRDLYILHHASQATVRAIRRRSPVERHERLLGVMRRASRRAWKLSATAAAGVVLASAAGSWVMLETVRPGDLDVALEAFESAWERGDRDALAARFHPEIRADRRAWLDGMAEGHGWGDGLGALEGERTVEPEGGLTDDHQVHYLAGGLVLSTRWGQVGREWFVTALELPVPPIEPTLERFVGAWQSAELERVNAFYPAEHEKMLAWLERSLDLRDWDAPPPILATEPGELRDGAEDPEREAVFVHELVDAGELQSTWLFRGDGRWGLQRLDFPELGRR